MALVCPHCRRDISVDLVLAQPMGDSRQRYALARELAALSAKPGLAAWVHLLEHGGVILSGVPAAMAEPVRARLAAAGQVATLEAHRAVSSGGKKRWVMVGAAVLVLAAAGLGLGLRRGPAPSAPPSPNQPALAENSATAEATNSEPAPPPPSPAAREVAAKIMPSVVVLRCKQQSGSGFFVTEHRLLTSEHITCGQDEPLTVEMADGTKGEAHVVTADERLDLAVLETSLTGTPLPSASAGSLSSGDTVMAAGAPVGLDRSFNVGTVSNTRRIMLGLCYVQIDARINKGNSGGPLVDSKGNVVGVVSMKQNQAEGIAFATPIDYAFDDLVTAPAWHPTPGFSEMLEAGRRDDQRVLEESEELSIRLVQAAFSIPGHVSAVMVTANYSVPQQVLSFRFEQDGRVACKMKSTVSWFENNPEQGFAKRTSQWLKRIGIGKVYTGATEFNAHGCVFSKVFPIELVLELEGNKTSRITL
jgi:serine protease Do